MIEIQLGEVGANRVRLAISPLEQVLNAVRLITRPGRAPAHARWAVANRPTLAGLDVPELITLIGGDDYFPDFLSPPPTGQTTTVEQQLDRVVDTPAEQVALEISLSRAGRDGREPAGLPADPERSRDLLAEQLKACWDALIEPMWPKLKDLLDTDMHYRTRQFGAGGIARVLTGLRPGVLLDGNRVLLPTFTSGQVSLDERGLLLVPGAFSSGIGVMLTPPWQPSLVYPARGTATLWEDVPAPEGDPLAGVVGRTKARLLRELASPASTTTLAQRLGVAPSTVSGHVKALTAAGLLSARRSGRSVDYCRSALGDEVVSSAS